MSDNVTIVIPIKTRNNRLPGKNTKLLNGKPLYSYLFATLKKLSNVSSVYVDSSDEEILRIAAENEFKTFKRAKHLNSDDTSGDDLLLNIMSNIKSEIVGQLHVTTPFLKSTTIQSAIDLMRSKPSINTVMGVIERRNRFWYKENPINHDIKNLIETQNLEPVYEESPDMYFFRRSSFLKYKRRVSGRIRFVTVDAIEGLDIDTIKDFHLAEAILKLGIS